MPSSLMLGGPYLQAPFPSIILTLWVFQQYLDKIMPLYRKGL